MHSSFTQHGLWFHCVVAWSVLPSFPRPDMFHGKRIPVLGDFPNLLSGEGIRKTVSLSETQCMLPTLCPHGRRTAL
jgi:hypothetical protein